MHCRSTSEREHREPAEQHDRSGERVVGAAANSASIMRELNPVPFEQWHGPWSDCRQRRPVPSVRDVKSAFVFDRTAYKKRYKSVTEVQLYSCKTRVRAKTSRH